MKKDLKIAKLFVLFAFLSAGLYQANACYDPGAQRWLNRDPIGEAGGINLFGYVGNDPVNQIDPLGLACCKQSYSECLATCVEKERFNMGAVLGTAASTLGFGTLPKTATEIAKGGTVGTPENPEVTGQLSRWAGRLGRAFGGKGARSGGFGWMRDLGRTKVFKFGLGPLATGALVFEGFYDIGAIGRCSVVCAQDKCAY
jgi:uncharacterized protein RhaS with RHS repeats